MKRKNLVLAMISFMASIIVFSADTEYKLPPETGIVNVKDFGAKGDGKTDDTEAIRKAIKGGIEKKGGSRYAFPPFVYFPKGTYLVSGPLESKVEPFGWSGGWRSGMLLLGESRTKTIIKLKDKAPGYGDSAKPKYLIATGSESDKRTKKGGKPLSGGGNRAFRHNIMNLTVDVGSGNPGAIGIDYVANNRGTIEDVIIKSSDPKGAGHTGLNLMRNWPGPCLYKNVTIEGFDTGINAQHYEYGNTFENLVLKNQRKYGLVNKQNMLAIHNLTSENAVPAIYARDKNGLTVVVNGSFKGKGKGPAVTGVGELYLRDIKVSGYEKAVDIAKRKGAKDVPTVDGKANIDLYVTEKFALGTKKAEPLRLPVKPTPTYWTNDTSKWAKPQDFLADPNVKPKDWTDAIQAALDSGKPVVALPNGSYRVSKTLNIPPSVRLIMGFQSSITPGKDNKDKVDPLLRFMGKGGKGTIVSHIWVSGHVEHDTDRPVTFSHCDLHGRYLNTTKGTGDFFIEDTIGPKPFTVAHGQNVWARQLNIEFGKTPLVINNGGNMWLLGYKTEGQMVCLQQTAGKTEVLGALLYPLRKVPGGTPAFFIQGGDAALTYAMSGPKYYNQVRVQGGNKIGTLTSKQAGGRSGALVRAKGGKNAVIATAPAKLLKEGEIPFWIGKSPHKDVKGNTWRVVHVGGKDDIPVPSQWSDLKFVAVSQRWEGDGMTDQAPSFNKNKALRGRPSQGKMVGLLFQPKEAGAYTMFGKAQVDTWGPDGPIMVYVQVVTKDGKVKPLLQKEFRDRATIDWAKIDSLTSITLLEGEKLMITFGSTRGGTGVMKLSPKKYPTLIRKVK